jgi:hypothetical protein
MGRIGHDLRYIQAPNVTKLGYMRFEVLTAVLMEIQVKHFKKIPFSKTSVTTYQTSV